MDLVVPGLVIRVPTVGIIPDEYPHGLRHLVPGSNIELEQGVAPLQEEVHVLKSILVGLIANPRGSIDASTELLRQPYRSVRIDVVIVPGEIRLIGPAAPANLHAQRIAEPQTRHAVDHGPGEVAPLPPRELHARIACDERWGHRRVHRIVESYSRSVCHDGHLPRREVATLIRIVRTDEAVEIRIGIDLMSEARLDPLPVVVQVPGRVLFTVLKRG